jgi:Domain of Unknown Function (DUF1080)
MKRLSSVTLGLLIVAITFAGCGHQLPGQGWITLIDGDKGLENFNRVGDANWRAEGGAVVADKGKGGYLVSKNSYKDFEIYAEFWADHTTNSGIRFRALDPNKLNDSNSYEANIYDQRPDALYGTGALSPDVARVNPMPKAGGKWNVYEIYAMGSQLTVKLNGAVTVSIQDSRYASGPIALQFGNRGKEPGGAIKWRKVQIRPL